MQNIGQSNADDAFYRYKMPKLVTKVEGRGNGIKTNVVNNVDVAKALERSPEYVLKYFGCELGAQTNYDAKSGTCIVNGSHEANKLSELLEGFIKRYVQCYSCGNPETSMKIKKEDIFLKCKACGFVSDVDMRHKLNTFIIKNPPQNKMRKEEIKLKNAEQERVAAAVQMEKAEKKENKEKRKEKKSENGEKKSDSGTSDKKEKKEKKDKKKKGEEGEGDADGDAEGADSESDVEEADDGVVWMTDTSADAVKKRAEEQLTAATAAMVTQGNIEAEQAEERKKARRAAEEAAARAEAEQAAADAEAAAAAAIAAELAAKLALEAAAAKGAGDAQVMAVRSMIASQAPAAVVAELRSMSVEGGIAGKMRVLYCAILGAGDDKVAAYIKASKALLAPFASDAAGQLAQLIALEHFLGVTAPERVKETPLALKALYDADLAEGDTIVAWAGKADAGKILGVSLEAGAAVRAAASPVVEWLQEDDDESEDEEEEE